MSTSIQLHRTSMFIWTCIMWFLRKAAPEAPVTEYFAEEVEKIKDPLTCVEEMAARALAQLSLADQYLILLADIPLTQAKAARRRYWKYMKPMPFVQLYRAQKLSHTEAEYVMRTKEKMPGYLRKQVLEIMAG